MGDGRCREGELGSETAAREGWVNELFHFNINKHFQDFEINFNYELTFTYYGIIRLGKMFIKKMYIFQFFSLFIYNLI